jgi:glutamate--cysteine ligase
LLRLSVLRDTLDKVRHTFPPLEAAMRTTHSTPINTVSTAIEPPLSEAAAEAWIPRTCFKNGPPSQIGVELELLVVDARHPDGLAAHYPGHRHPELLLDLAAGGGLDGQLTVEPGGQVELSSRPGPTVAQTIDVVRNDLAVLRARAARSGARLIGFGVDPVRPPVRIVDQPRYVAMEQYFGGWGSAGRVMMCSTASVQVNVEAGVLPPPTNGARRPAPAGIGLPAGRSAPSPLQGIRQRWDLLHAIGPALVAAFANSPRRAGRPTGWKSTRQAVWMRLDPARTGVPTIRPGEELEWAFTRWALDAPLLLVRRDHAPWTAPAGVSFRQWLRRGRGVVPDRHPPTPDDLAYHLTTLFPQVRPRGHLEVRFIDAQPGQWWTVPPAVIAALLDDETAADRARHACAPIEGRWRDAARAGMDDAELARAATRLLEIAVGALRAAPANTWLAGQVEGYLDRWTARGRCPADDPLAGFAGPTSLRSNGTQGDEPS